MRRPRVPLLKRKLTLHDELIYVFCCRFLLNISQLLNNIRQLSNISPHGFFQIGFFCQNFTGNSILLINSALKIIFSNRIFCPTGCCFWNRYISCFKIVFKKIKKKSNSFYFRVYDFILDFMTETYEI